MEHRSNRDLRSSRDLYPSRPSRGRALPNVGQPADACFRCKISLPATEPRDGVVDDAGISFGLLRSANPTQRPFWSLLCRGSHGSPLLRVVVTQLLGAWVQVEHGVHFGSYYAEGTAAREITSSDDEDATLSIQVGSRHYIFTALKLTESCKAPSKHISTGTTRRISTTGSATAPSSWR
jgi:hypothetical protein